MCSRSAHRRKQGDCKTCKGKQEDQGNLPRGGVARQCKGQTHRRRNDKREVEDAKMLGVRKNFQKGKLCNGERKGKMIQNRGRRKNYKSRSNHNVHSMKVNNARREKEVGCDRAWKIMNNILCGRVKAECRGFGAKRRKQTHPDRAPPSFDPSFRGATVTIGRQKQDGLGTNNWHLNISVAYCLDQKYQTLGMGSPGKGSASCMSKTEREERTSTIEGHRCVSCETKTTPMWRKTPAGKRLCNACGIRYRKYGNRCSRCWFVPRRIGNTKHICSKTPLCSQF
uniref:GATA-type domain-containing protein n=1 Tax=Eptatretus burgeri TaxID=7764 RepID=A0A8C4Q522_EPTBU